MSLPDSVVSGFSAFRTYQLFQGPSVLLLGYDYLLTFSDEIELVWAKEWSIPNIIFYFNRYLPFLDALLLLLGTFLNPSDARAQSTCSALYKGHAWLVSIGVNIAECLFIIRTYAIWDNQTVIAVGLLASLLGTFAVESFYLARVESSFGFIRSPSPAVFPGCFPTQVDTSSATPAYLTLFIYETVVFLITFYKLLLRRLENHGSPSNLLKTLIRDGLTFYFLISAISLVNLILLRTLPAEYGLVLNSFHRFLHSILAARLILNLRRAAKSAIVSTDCDVEMEVSQAFAVYTPQGTGVSDSQS